jgi:pimeloyl-ACP methyl ester carboxylesterase
MSRQLTHGPLSFGALTAGAKGAPVVLCLHGFPDAPTTWRHQLPALAAAGYRVVAPAMRGYEPSSQPANADYTVAEMASDVLAWANQLGGRIHLVGHDWGALVAYAVAAREPSCFASLTALAVPHPGRIQTASRGVPGQLLNSSYVGFFQVPGLSDWALRRDDWAWVRRLWRRWSPSYTMPSEDWRALRSTLEAPGVARAMLAYYRQNAGPAMMLGRRDMMAGRRTVAVPTLAITGVEDGCIDTRVFVRAMRDEDFPGGLRVERVGGAGHFVHLERPGAVNALLLSWLAAAAR